MCLFYILDKYHLFPLLRNITCSGARQKSNLQQHKSQPNGVLVPRPPLYSRNGRYNRSQYIPKPYQASSSTTQPTQNPATQHNDNNTIIPCPAGCGKEFTGKDTTECSGSMPSNAPLVEYIRVNNIPLHPPHTRRFFFLLKKKLKKKTKR